MSGGSVGSGYTRAAVDALDTGVRGGPDPAEITSASFGGITIPEA